MQYIVDNYGTIAEQALIVPMDSSQAAKAKSAFDERDRLAMAASGTSRVEAAPAP